MGDRVIVSCVTSKFVIRSLSFELLGACSKLQQINLFNRVCEAESPLKALITYIRYFMGTSKMAS